MHVKFASVFKPSANSIFYGNTVGLFKTKNGYSIKANIGPRNLSIGDCYVIEVLNNCKYRGVEFYDVSRVLYNTTKQEWHF